ncbi:MAG: ATP-binding cassette domain-containing protein [Planctomycetes bacterium]|nr:ATP-binding cassette domain-containing protein [Planctomycetota bacterium]
MTLVVVDDLRKHFGAQEVLSGATLQLDEGERVGLVGPNGAGKSTLVAMIAGLDTPDWGKVQRRKGVKVGHVPQRPEFGAGVTVRSYVEGGLAYARELIQEFEKIGDSMGEAEGEELDKLLERHTALSERIDAAGAWEIGRRVEAVLSGIGLGEAFWDREASTLSGGEKNRAALARELAAGHDLLLLDEPTNHLDLEGIEWMEAWLSELKTGVLIVSHDRRLLENAVTNIVEVERGSLTRYPGKFSKYLELKAERFESALRAWEIQIAKVRREEVFIKKHMGSQRTAEAKGRMKKLENLERLEQPYLDVRRPVIQAPKAERGGELVLEARGLKGGYGDNVLFEDVSLRIGRGERVGIVGPNGAGKSTLLKIITGRAAPIAGEVDKGHGAVCGFYDQDTSALRDDGTPMTELRRVRPAWTDLEVRSHLAKFLFRGDEVEKSVSALSGGERARLSLAKLLVTEPTWLAMDEPTNHIDLAGRTALEEMLGEFSGALVCVSHDREFLDGLCGRIIEVSGGAVREFRGNYTDYRRVKTEEQEQAHSARKDEERRAKKAAQESAAKAKEPKKKRAKNPWKLEKVEAKIMELEEELERLRVSLGTEEVYKDQEATREVQFQIAELERALEEANEEWEQWAD